MFLVLRLKRTLNELPGLLNPKLLGSPEGFGSKLNVLGYLYVLGLKAFKVRASGLRGFEVQGFGTALGSLTIIALSYLHATGAGVRGFTFHQSSMKR